MQLLFKAKDLIYFIYFIYRSFRDAIQWLLENTIIKANPSLATQFSDAITLLTTLTVILLMMELISGAKKILAIIVAIGWALLIVSMAISIHG